MRDPLEKIIKDIHEDLESLYTLSRTMNSGTVKVEVHSMQKRLKFIEKKFNNPITKTIV